MRRRQSRELIVDVDRRWRKQYPPNDTRWYTPERGAIYDQLHALDLTTASAAEVSAIVGNQSWSTFRCDECGESFEEVVSLRDWDDYNSLEVCLDCLRKAVSIGEQR